MMAARCRDAAGSAFFADLQEQETGWIPGAIAGAVEQAIGSPLSQGGDERREVLRAFMKADRGNDAAAMEASP